MPDLLYIVDTFSLMFQVFHAIPEMTGPSGQPTNAVFGFTRDLQTIRTKFNPTHLVCALDSGGHAVRNDTFAEYKANRADMPDDLAPQIPCIVQVMEGLRIPGISFPGWEADDVIATLVREAVERDFEVRIVTSDKDVRQLLGPRVQVYNVRKNTFYDEASLAAEWGIRPDQVVDFQALVGDSVDNVPGIPLIGPKKASALLQQFETLEGVLANADKASGAKLKENLKNFADQARVSRRLVELNSRLPLDFDWEAARVQEPDRERLLALFTEFGFRRLADEMRGTQALAAGATAAPGATQKQAAEGRPGRRPASKSTQAAFAFQSSETAVEAAGESVNELGEPAAETVAPAFQPSPLPEHFGQVRIVDTNEALKNLVTELGLQSRLGVNLSTNGPDAMRASIVGWTFGWEGSPAFYIPVDGPPGQTVLEPRTVLEALKPILERPDIEFVNHDIKFDTLVLSVHGIELGPIGVDPLVGDYLLDAGARTHGLEALSDKFLNRRMTPLSDLLGSGARQKRFSDLDVEAAARFAAEEAHAAMRIAQIVGERLREENLWELYWDLERPLIGVLTQMEKAGIVVDVDELRRQSGELTLRLARLVQEIHQEAGGEFNIDSPLQLRGVLFDRLKLPVIKRTKTGPSTDQEVLERLAPMHRLPAMIIEHRQLSKLKGTYLDALPLLLNPTTCRIHCSFNQVVAATGRLSSSDPNLQNIPIRAEEGRRVRRAFLAPPGSKLLCADYSQIELRMLAHFSQDVALQAAFREGTDIHTAVASDIFGVEGSAVDANMRRVAKAVNFGVIYGQSRFGLSTVLGISQDEAATFITSYFERYPGVDRYLHASLRESAATGYARTILGRRRPISGIRDGEIDDFGPNRQRNLSERTAINAVIQGSAADLIKKAMLQLSARIKQEHLPVRMLLQIHDELVFEVSAEHVDSVAAIVQREMQQALELDVPLVVDLSVGENWLDIEPIE